MNRHKERGRVVKKSPVKFPTRLIPTITVRGSLSRTHIHRWTGFSCRPEIQRTSVVKVPEPWTNRSVSFRISFQPQRVRHLCPGPPREGTNDLTWKGGQERVVSVKRQHRGRLLRRKGSQVHYSGPVAPEGPHSDH